MIRTVAVVVFPGVQSLDVTGPMDVFAEANRFLPAEKHYAFEVISLEKGLITCSNGLVIAPHSYYQQSEVAFDLVLCAGGPSLPTEAMSEDVYDWLRKVAGRSNRYGSICNGAFMLGRAGLLDGRKVATHWSDVQALASLCPTAHVELDHLYVHDRNLLTSAGITAGIDLSLYIVSHDHSPEVALNVAKRLVVFTQRAGGQSQFSPYLTTGVESTSLAKHVQDYVLSNLMSELSIARLAEISSMSSRNFARVFLRETGITPGEFVERARVDAARKMLESETAALKVVAYRTGFSDAHRMREVFKRRLGVSPQQFRANFKALT
ncbi:GlxA family transcriptional regulator [Pseudomonas sp. NPDC090203]|uniref:GlxA family transcriptional regulator n=1 Tax=Pseudomonas sp. NPDC090203 TaxID=3364477 RepID=UPI0037FDC3C0